MFKCCSRNEYLPDFDRGILSTILIFNSKSSPSLFCKDQCEYIQGFPTLDIFYQDEMENYEDNLLLYYQYLC